jgi:hypothetical protein
MESLFVKRPRDSCSVGWRNKGCRKLQNVVMKVSSCGDYIDLQQPVRNSCNIMKVARVGGR